MTDFITGQGRKYTDLFGTMTSKPITRLGEATTNQTFTMAASTNRISGVGYDDDGDQAFSGPYAYGYDAFNMMKTYTGGGIDKLFLYTAADERYWTLDYSLAPDHPQETFTLRDLDGQVLALLNFEWVDLEAPEAPCGRRGKPKTALPTQLSAPPTGPATAAGKAPRGRARSGKAPGATGA
jgi:hypothetical protein